MLYDCIIIGGGPAGTAAAVYAARKKLKTLFLTDSFGGQSSVSDDIQNWIGDHHISGFDLAKKFEAHVRSFTDTVDVHTAELARQVSTVASTDAGRQCDFEVTTDKGTYRGKTLILATGARRRKLGIPGESEFEGKGVAYCSTCDAPIFSGKKVAVIGGGNAGLETVQDLFPYAAEIYLLEYSGALKGDQKTQEEITQNPKLKRVILNAEALAVLGEKFVTGIRYKDRLTGEEHDLAVQGVFVEVGSVPNSELVKNLVELDARGQIIVDAKHGTTSHAGIFAAGDVTDDPYKQNNISAGDAIKALLAAYAYLLQRAKQSPAEKSA
ncbi:MAG: FAD-dependent oxidoreductase [Parcubacteria group bacterium]|nr:FAD-dependent oxidoreductase [Parcubacteria group bacterium]